MPQQAGQKLLSPKGVFGQLVHFFSLQYKCTALYSSRRR
jgi:hypothetical protein